MSVSITEAARVALVSLLRGDVDLLNILAPHPVDASLPALFLAHSNFTAPVYPCLAYRIETDIPDKQFRPPNVGGGKPPIRNLTVCFEAWTNAPDAGDIDAIGARLEALFDNEQVTLADGSGVIFRGTCITTIPDMYDKDLNAFWGAFRYRFQTDTGEH